MHNVSAWNFNNVLCHHFFVLFSHTVQKESPACWCFSVSCVLQTVITWMINIPWKTKCLQEFSVLFYFMKTLLQLASTQQFFMYQKLLTFHNSTFCPHSAFLCFIWLSEQTAIIYLYINHWLDFIIEKKCVSCAVRTDESLNTIQVHIRLSRADKRNALSAVL